MNKNLKKLLIKTKKSVFSQQIGNNTSKFKGEGYDFVELREYEDGEDIRKIDWVISAKQQKPYVKVFHTQRELNIVIAPILIGSLHFGTSKFKQELVSEICAILGYSCSAQSDSFSSYICNNDVVLNTKKTKKLFAVDTMVSNIYNYNCLGQEANYNKVQIQLYNQIKEKSIIFIIGDFFDIESLNLQILAKKHEVVAIIVRDRFEESPSKLGNVNLIDPSSNSSFNGNINSSIIKKYEQKVKVQDNQLYNLFKKSSIQFTKIYTDENPMIKMMKLFR